MTYIKFTGDDRYSIKNGQEFTSTQVNAKCFNSGMVFRYGKEGTNEIKFDSTNGNGRDTNNCISIKGNGSYVPSTVKVNITAGRFGKFICEAYGSTFGSVLKKIEKEFTPATRSFTFDFTGQSGIKEVRFKVIMGKNTEHENNILTFNLQA